jgi:hypothetical protein
MFNINYADKTITLTRGDAAVFNIGADIITSSGSEQHFFKVGDVIRFKVTAKKNCEDVVLVKDAKVTEETAYVQIALDSDETKFGDVISKPMEYWYEVELYPDTYAQTIIGYDEETGAKILRLLPEGGDE